MKLSPLDIKRQQFGKAFRGYDPDEVDAFVKQVASQWESVLDELRLSTERNRELAQKLKHYERVELALQEALETARETARRSEEAADRKAKIIVEQAELKAERTLQDVEQERFGLRRDIAKLTGRQNEVAARLRAFLMSELEILAQFQGDDPVGFIRLESASSHTTTEQLRAHEPTAPPIRDEADEPATNELTEERVASELSTPPDLEPAPQTVETMNEQTDPTEPTAADRERTDLAPESFEEPAETDPPADTAPEEAPPETESAPAHSAEDEALGSTLDASPPIAEPEPPSEPSPMADDPLDWELPETVEPEVHSESSSDWNLRTLVTGESDSVAGSEAERERIRRILEDLD